MKVRSLLFFVLFLFLGQAGLCVPKAHANDVIVLASWYGLSPDVEGFPMANGKPFSSNDRTIAAHPSLPFGTRLLVTNPETGRWLIVVVQDRGRFPKGRKLDLSFAAAKVLGYAKKGVTYLHMRILET